METDSGSNSDIQIASLVKRMEQHSKFVQWDRDVNGKLYYALWIVFMGGFVLSVNSSVLLDSPTCCTIMLLHVFRILALVGSALNFFLQNQAINAARFSHESLINYRQHIDLVQSHPKDAAAAYQRAETARIKTEAIDASIPWMEWPLRIIAGAFLVLAYWLTMNVIPILRPK